ncbi:pachytene checkpoint protein 2 homolog [Arachis stenosperma]|uniref:pachytene checkpoint protein 2 homolog n=1 Tax=Arachis stenosperma TaxID=217475 RepID=UPI0025AC0596|nr:pachytene checkpoint protein 2 homolog [Arachis stenosperma]
MVVGVFLDVTVAVVEAHRRRRERRSLLALLLGVWREWPCSSSASGFCKLLESSAAGNQHWSCPKQRLLRYAASALLFTEKGVDPFLVSWNRDPGIGKISLCKALAQKLSIRFNSRCTNNTVKILIQHLPMRQFSENGCKTFPKDSRNGKEESNLVFVLIDEVESLAAARKAAISGSDPSDSIRVVNALLTQIDKLKSSPNVIILTTSNITTTIGKSL